MPLYPDLIGAYAPLGGGTLPTGAVAQTLDRAQTMASVTGTVSGRLELMSIWLPAGRLISTITLFSGSQAAVDPTNQWFALFNNAALPARLGITNNDTTTAWAAIAAKTLTLASPFTTTYSGTHYIGRMVTVTTTMPTKFGINNGSGGVIGGIAPAIAAVADTGLTNTASCPSTLTTFNGAYDVFMYGYVS